MGMQPDHDVPALMKALKQSKPPLRRKAVRALAQFGAAAEPALPCLRQILSDPDPRVREETVRTLAHLGPAAIPLLIESLANPDAPVRRQAVWTLKQLAPASQAAVPALIGALRDRDLKVRKGAALALEVLDPEPDRVIPALVAALRDTNVVFCRLVASALAKLGVKAVPALTNALTSPDRYVRREAAWALGQIGPEARSAVPALVWALRSATHGPRSAGSESQRKLAPDGATPVVVVEPFRHPNRSFLLYVAEALGRIGPEAQTAVPALRDATRDPDEKLRAAATEALARIQDEEGLPDTARVPTLPAATSPTPVAV